MDQTATKETQNYLGSITPGTQQQELCDAHPHILFNLSLKGIRIISQKCCRSQGRTSETAPTASAPGHWGLRGPAAPRGVAGGGATCQWRPRFLTFLLLPGSVGDVEVTCNSGRKPPCSQDHGRSCEDASLRVQQALQVIPVSALEQNWFRAIRVSPELGINPFSPRCLDT